MRFPKNTSLHKTTILALRRTLATFLILAASASAEPPPSPTPTPTSPATPAPEPVAPTSFFAIPADDRLKFNPAPQVRLDVLMLSVPVEKAVPLLPALRDPQRIEAAQAELLAMVARREATLIDWPELTTYSGNRAVTETFVDERRLTDPEPPRKPGAPALIDEHLFTPGQFEIRDLGTSLEMESGVSLEDKTVALSFAIKLTMRDPRPEPPVGQAPDGKFTTSREPVYYTAMFATYFALRDGERRLCYVGRQGIDGPLQLFIVGVKILPSPK